MPFPELGGFYCVSATALSRIIMCLLFVINVRCLPSCKAPSVPEIIGGGFN